MTEKLIFLTFFNEFYAFYLGRKEVLGPISQANLHRAAETDVYIFNNCLGRKIKDAMKNNLQKD